ncbi:MAG: hypothetical protein KJ047_12145 [Anaerolineae bacterium]|nr:hypothetical protein [Anaerolineae bacterium]
MPYTWAMLTDTISLEGGQGALLAFLPRPDPDAIAAAAVALANTDGGAIVIGLDEGGVYRGPLDGVAVARALLAAADCCTPPIPLGTPEILSTPGGPALAVRVPRGRRVHALSDGSVLARSDFGNRALGGDEIRGLLSARANGDFEAEAVPGARIADLDPALLAAFMVARARRLGQPVEDVPLAALGAITPDHGVTVAGLLLFGRDPSRWLPQASAQFLRYLGPAGDAHLAFERSFAGPLISLFDQLWEAIRAQMHAPVGKPDALEYPAAVREVLANALCHRDYRLRERLTVRLYADCLEVVSPGGLPAFLTTTHLVGGRYSRNPRLASALAQWGYADGRGGGVLRILRAMDRRGARPPLIETGPYSVTVRLFNECVTGAGAPDQPPEDALNERQRAALAHVRAHGSITFHELRALHPALRPDLLQRDLSALVQGGYLRRVGGRAGAYYLLP